MLTQTRLKHRWAEELRDDVAASAPTAISASLSPTYPSIPVWTHHDPAASVPADASEAHAPHREFTEAVYGHVPRLLENWLLGATQEAAQPPASRPMRVLLMGQVGNIVWRYHDLDESLRHALNSARRQLFESLVAAWKTETVFVSSVTEKWSHPAYQSIVEMGKPAIPLILEQIGDGERLWTQALLSITTENPAEATRTPEEAQQAWLNWGEERGWLNP